MSRRFVAPSAHTFVFFWLLAGCGDYSQPKDTGTGGSAGTAPTGGSSGTSQSGSGGTSPQGGSATGGTGAQAGGGAGGTSGQAGGGAAGSGSGGGAGGSAGGGSCADVAACGGDLVGAWTVGSCPLAVTGTVDLSGLGLNNDCMSTPITSGSMQLTGTLTFVAGGTYMDGTTTAGEVAFDLAPPCLVLSGTRTTCEMIASPIRSVGFTTLTCTDNTTTMGCTCEGTFQQMGGLGFVSYDAAQSGTFTVTDNKVAISSFSMPAEYSFCVGGNTLTMNMESVAKTGTVDGPIVLTK